MSRLLMGVAALATLLAMPVDAGERRNARVDVDVAPQVADVQVRTQAPLFNYEVRERTVMVPETVYEEVPVEVTRMVPVKETIMQRQAKTVQVPKVVSELVQVPLDPCDPCGGVDVRVAADPCDPCAGVDAGVGRTNVDVDVGPVKRCLFQRLRERIQENRARRNRLGTSVEVRI